MERDGEREREERERREREREKRETTPADLPSLPSRSHSPPNCIHMYFYLLPLKKGRERFRLRVGLLQDR